MQYSVIVNVEAAAFGAKDLYGNRLGGLIGVVHLRHLEITDSLRVHSLEEAVLSLRKHRSGINYAPPKDSTEERSPCDLRAIGGDGKVVADVAIGE